MLTFLTIHNFWIFHNFSLLWFFQIFHVLHILHNFAFFAFSHFFHLHIFFFLFVNIYAFFPQKIIFSFLFFILFFGGFLWQFRIFYIFPSHFLFVCFFQQFLQFLHFPQKFFFTFFCICIGLFCYFKNPRNKTKYSLTQRVIIAPDCLILLFQQHKCGERLRLYIHINLYYNYSSSWDVLDGYLSAQCCSI